MNKNEILFDTEAFLKGTYYFNDQERGIYIKLLCEQHQFGHLPASYFETVCISADVASRFIKDAEGCYYNELFEKRAKASPKKKVVIEFDLRFVEQPWSHSFQKWLAYKKSRNESYKTQASLEACYRNLKRLSDDDPIKGDAVVDNAMGSNYMGLVPLKTWFKPQNNSRKYLDGKR